MKQRVGKILGIINYKNLVLPVEGYWKRTLNMHKGFIFINSLYPNLIVRTIGQRIFEAVPIVMNY